MPWLGALSTDLLISHRFSVDEAVVAYDLLRSREPSLGILLDYPELQIQSSYHLSK